MDSQDAQLSLMFLDSQAAAPRQWALVASGGEILSLEEARAADGSLTSGLVWASTNVDRKPTLQELEAALPDAHAWAATL